MKQNKFLYYPILLFLFLFLLDKVFLLDSIRILIKPDFTYVYYEVKEELLKYFLSHFRSGELKGKKVMVMLGSSRLLYFDNKELEDFYPQWAIYNFSSAVTTPAYYYYYLEKILQSGIRPDLVVIETDPNQFNINSVFKESNLTYSFDFSFIWRYASLLGKDYFFYYIGKSLFAVMVNKPYLDTIFQNLNNPNLPMVKKMKEKIWKSLIANKGHAMSPVEDYFERDAAVLLATSQRTIDWLFSSYQPSDMQFAFFEMIVRDLNKEKIPLLIVWPQSSRSMQDRLKGSDITTSWLDRVESIASRYGFHIQNMDDTDEYYCNSFADGGHIARDCYRPFIRYIMIRYFNLYQL